MLMLGVFGGGVAGDGEDVRVVGGDDDERVVLARQVHRPLHGVRQRHGVGQCLLSLVVVVGVVHAATCKRSETALTFARKFSDAKI